VLYHLGHSPALFVLGVFEIGSHFMHGTAWIVILLFVLPHVDGMTGTVHQHAQLLVEMGSPKLFAPSGLTLW
jgi:hypothetical protein